MIVEHWNPVNSTAFKDLIYVMKGVVVLKSGSYKNHIPSEISLGRLKVILSIEGRWDTPLY